MTDELQSLRSLLLHGIKRSGQSSYERRAPDQEAVPYLLQARTGLKAYVRQYPTDPEGWRLLSQAEECLLSYAAAIYALEMAMAQSAQRDRRDLKRLVLLQEYAAKWQGLGLEPAELAELDTYLEQHLAEQPCDHTLRHTHQWLRERRIKHSTRVLQALRSQGGFCDCEVLANVV
jgi:hypothetical protein